MSKDTTPALIVRRLGTREEVDRVEIHTLSRRHVERVMMGMLINMRDDCFIDSTEVYAAIRAREAS